MSISEVLLAKQGKSLHRHQRMAQYLKRYLSEILLREINDELVRLITITHVNVDPMCRHANIYFVKVGSHKTEELVKRVSKASGFIRTRLASMMHTRFVPMLHFSYDDHIESAHHITSLISSVSNSSSSHDE